ncbi:MAG: hypothetical protein ACE5IA_03015 [Dehalococcoidia bacterium]
MNIMELENLARSKAKEVVESGQKHENIALIDGPQGLQVVLLAIDDKDQFVAGLTELLRRVKAERYVMVSEAWATTSARPLSERIGVGQLPPDDREEILLIVSCERGKKVNLTTARIDNTPAGRRVGEFTRMEEGWAKGRMIVNEWEG